MSIVFAEGFDRFPSAALALYQGVSGKVVDIRTGTSGGTPRTVSVSAVSGNRNGAYATTRPANNEVSQNSTCYLDIFPSNAPLDDPQRNGGSCVPTWGNAAKMVVSWKLFMYGNLNVQNNSSYLASIGGVTFSCSMDQYNGIAKGYVTVEMVYDRRALKGYLYIEGVLRHTITLTANNLTPRISLTGLRGNNGAGNISVCLQSIVTDITVVFDDGIAPTGRMGEVAVRDVPLARVTPGHADVELVAGVDVTTTLMHSSVIGTKLIGTAGVEVYRPKAAPPRLGTGTLLAIVQDETRQAGSPVAGDLVRKIITPNGTTSITERPVTNKISLQSLIRNFNKPTSVKVLVDDVRVELSTAAR